MKSLWQRQKNREGVKPVKIETKPMKITLVVMGIVYGMAGLMFVIAGLVQWNPYAILVATVQILVSIVFFWAYSTIKQLQCERQGD